jgi:hypothetical protein
VVSYFSDAEFEIWDGFGPAGQFRGFEFLVFWVELKVVFFHQCSDQ